MHKETVPDPRKWESDAAQARKEFYLYAEREGLLEDIGKPSGPRYDHSPIVNSPKHYQSNNDMEVIDIIDAFDLGAYEANIVKYVLRYKKKNGIEDLKKAEWYLKRLIKKQEIANHKRPTGTTEA